MFLASFNIESGFRTIGESDSVARPCSASHSSAAMATSFKAGDQSWMEWATENPVLAVVGGSLTIGVVGSAARLCAMCCAGAYVYSAVSGVSGGASSSQERARPAPQVQQEPLVPQVPQEPLVPQVPQGPLGQRVPLMPLVGEVRAPQLPSCCPRPPRSCQGTPPADCSKWWVSEPRPTPLPRPAIPLWIGLSGCRRRERPAGNIDLLVYMYI